MLTTVPILVILFPAGFCSPISYVCGRPLDRSNSAEGHSFSLRATDLYIFPSISSLLPSKLQPILLHYKPVTAKCRFDSSQRAPYADFPLKITRGSLYPHSSGPTIALSSTEALPEMCVEVHHKYACGCTKVQRAPCANSRAGGCRGLTTKTVAHGESCSGHGGW